MVIVDDVDSSFSYFHGLLLGCVTAEGAEGKDGCMCGRGGCGCKNSRGCEGMANSAPAERL